MIRNKKVRSRLLCHRYRRVPLSVVEESEATAAAVGKRHGKPVVLKIDARLMHEKGITFYQADNGVWLTKTVPVSFIFWEA
ncbi:RNA 2'-phosphotransferase [Citrobacter enshiensis]|uniref:RNA 2'-phosphotransferase n=1 Tax=Citrobacter enshiensis TaxID=2971264 RepID=UPI002E1D841C